MEAIFVEHKFEEKLQKCRKDSVGQQKTQGVLMHEAFCCKKDIFRFIEPETDDEIALIAEYIKLDQSKARVICRLRVGNDVYELKLL